MENFKISSAKPYWEFVKITDFKVPKTTVDRTLKRRIFNFINVLKNSDNRETEFLVSKDETTPINSARLKKIITSPDWKIPSAALEIALKDWLQSKKMSEPFKLIIGPPFLGHTEILTTFARLNNFNVIIPPSADQILHQDITYFDQFKKNTSPWVIPSLEKFFFRHTKGLYLIRRLFDALYNGKLGHGMIGCDSWAWAFLDHVIQGDFFSILIPQAFQAEQMTEFLIDIVSFGSEKLAVFRQIGDGKLILAPHLRAEPELQKKSSKCQWIKLMSEYCRGNPGIGLEYWRQSLRDMASKEDIEKLEKVDDDFSEEKALWIIPWDKLSRKSIPGEMNRDHARVLYTILIHGGLPLRLLYSMLPFSEHDSARLLRFLHSVELVEKHFEICRVSPFAFPAIIEYLSDEGYPAGL